MYVFLWPRSSAGSFSPPKLILTNFLFRLFAMLSAKVVLPTPGGPTKHIIGLLLSLLVSTATYSSILVLTSSSP